MSNRERWIIYPLLLFTLLTTMSRKLFESGMAEFGTIQCHELVVTSPDGSPRIALRQDAMGGGGMIAVYGLTQPIITGSGDEAAVIGIRGRVASNKLELGVDRIGGYVNVVGSDALPALRLGHVEQKRASGLVATDTHGTLLAQAGQDGASWGTTLAWDDVPDSSRDYVEAMADFAEPDATDGESANGESTEDDSPGDATNSEAAESAAGDEESQQRPGRQNEDDSAYLPRKSAKTAVVAGGESGNHVSR